MKYMKYWVSGISFLFFLGFFIHLVSARTPSPSLDSMMTPEEREKTGLYKLSVLEKIELKNWIDKNYIRSERTARGQYVYRLPEVSEVIYNGQFLRLDDGTLWQIFPEDTPLAASWITPAGIEVSPSGRGGYPYTLTNRITGTTIRARKVDSLPKEMGSQTHSHVYIR